MTASPPSLRVHAIWPRSRSNGPGVRAVVWLQGCTLGCAGCFNASTHDPHGGEARSVRDVFEEIDVVERGASGRREPPVIGVTVSGGEPFQQPEGLLALLREASSRGLSVLVFSGYDLDEIHALPLGRSILAYVDVLVAGRYVANAGPASEAGATQPLLGSSNQQVHLLTDRHTARDLDATPAAEVRVRTDGTLEFSGIDPLRVSRRSRARS